MGAPSRHRIALLAALVFALSQPARAQLAPPNDTGVAMGHPDPGSVRVHHADRDVHGAKPERVGRHLEQLTKNLEASGIALDRPYRVRRPGEARTALSYVLDPWGTAIEMTEHLAPDAL